MLDESHVCSITQLFANIFSGPAPAGRGLGEGLIHEALLPKGEGRFR